MTNSQELKTEVSAPPMRFEIKSNRCLSNCLPHCQLTTSPFEGGHRGLLLALPSNRCLSNCLPHLDRLRRGDYQSPVALPKTVPFIVTTVQTYYFAPLRGAFLSCFAKKGTKEGDLGEALRLCCGNTSTFRHYPDSPNSPSPKTLSAQGISSTNQIENLGSHLPCFAKS